jgi:ABC-type transport system involved in multi-copper enzyme maturation permease subunit
VFVGLLILLAVLAAVAQRLGWWTIIGPVFLFEMVRAGRRDRNHAVRSLFGFILLFALLSFYLLCLVYEGMLTKGTTVSALPASILGDFLLAFFGVLSILQFFAAWLLTPAYLAGAIVEEREQNTLEALLASDLRDREIALGIVLPRFLNLLLVFLASMPIISALQFVGGIDPNLVLTSYAFLGLNILSLGTLSVLCSLYGRDGRSALLRVYALAFGYLGLSGLSWTLIWPLDLGSFPSTDTWLSPVTVKDLVQWFNAGNFLAWTVRGIYDLFSGVALDKFLQPALEAFAWFHGSIAAVAMVWVGLRFRRVLLSPRAVSDRRGETGQGTAWLFGLNGRPRVFNWPMIWKELYVEGPSRHRWRSALRSGVLVAFFATPFLISIYFYDGFTALGEIDQLNDMINIWIRLLSLVLGMGMLIAVAMRAAGSVSGERTRETLSGLLATPLTSRSILWSKWLGSILSPRRMALTLAFIWALGICVRAIHPLAVAGFVITWLVIAGFVAAVGMWFSVIKKTSHRATFWTIFTLSIGLGLTYLAAYDLSDLVISPQHAEMILPPALFLVLPISPGDLKALQDPRQNPGFGAVPFVLLFWSFLGVVIWKLTRWQFRRQFNRKGDGGNSSLDLGQIARSNGDTTRVPKRARIRWLRLAGQLLVLLLPTCLLIGVFEYWRYQSHVELARSQAEADRLDPHWRWDEMEARRKPIPPEQNSALVLQSVSKVLPKDYWSEESRVQEYLQDISPERRLHSRAEKRLRKLITNVKAGLQEARRVANMPEGRFPPSPNQDLLTALMGWSQGGSLSQLLRDAALLCAQDGDEGEAMMWCRAAVNGSCAISGDESAMGAYLRAISMLAAVDGLERTLALGEPPDQALSAVQPLLEKEAQRPAILQQFRSGRAVMDRLLQLDVQNSWNPLFPYQVKTSQPRFARLISLGWTEIVRILADGARSLTSQRALLLGYYNDLVEAAKLPDHLQEGAITKVESKFPAMRRRSATMYFFFGDLSRRYQIRLAMARTQCAVVALACERYRLKYGKWPERLEDLVPEFQQKLPTDPYDGKLIRLRRLADGLVIYSVGPDGVDNGGALERKVIWRLPAGKDVGFQLWDPSQRRRPAVEPATGDVPDDD